MFRNAFRKYIVASRVGFTLFYAVTFLLVMSFGFGFNTHSLVIFGAFGLVGGYIMATKTHKDSKYFIDNLEGDKFTLMQRFKEMLAKEEVPKTEQERSEYRKYLQAQEENKVRLSGSKQWWAMAFLAGMFILYLVSVGLNLLAMVFTAVLISGGYQIIKSKRDLEKIARLKQKLSETE